MTYIEKIIDVTTGEETIRNYSAKEIAEVEANIAKATIATEEIAQKATDKAALLAKLGITEEEASLLLG